MTNRSLAYTIVVIKLSDSPLYQRHRQVEWQGAVGKETASDRIWHLDRQVKCHRPP